MADILYSESTGQYFAKLPGNRYLPLQNEDQARAVQESGVEAFINAAGNAIGQTITGAGALAQLPGARDAFDQLSGTQQARVAASPTAGQVGSLVPDVAVGAATGGSGPLARRVGLTAAVEGGLGAAQNPDNPAIGAAVGAGAGAIGGAGLGLAASPGAIKGIRLSETISNAVNIRSGRRAEIRAIREAAENGTPLRRSPTVGDDSLSAARAVDPSDIQSTPILGRGTINSQRLQDDYGFPTSPAQARMLDTGDPAEFNSARAQDAEEFNRFRSGITGPITAAKSIARPIEDYGALRTVQQNALNTEVMRAMGENVKTAATRRNVGEARKAISDSYNDIAARAAPINGQQIADNIDAFVERAALDDTVSRKLVSYRDQINTYLDDQGMITARDFMAIKNDVKDTLTKAYGREPNLLLGDALREIDTDMDAALMRALDPEDKAQMRENRFRWGVANAALRSSAATNARGDVNIQSFTNSYARGNRRFKIGYDDSEFANFLDTAAAVMMKEVPDSGSPRGVAELFKVVGEAAGVPGMGLLR